MAVGLKDADDSVIHTVNTIHHFLGDFDTVGSRAIDTEKIIVKYAEVIPRCQLILEALGPELHVALRNKTVKYEFFPRGALIIEGIEASDVEKSRQLNDQPVMAGAIVAQLEGVLPDRLEDLNDQGIR